MKLITFGIAILFLASLAAASDLAEAAKKEKKRREALAQQNVKSRVLTNEDVSNLKSNLAMESTGGDEDSKEITAADPSTAEDAKKQELDQKAETHRAEIEKLKQEIEEKRKAAAEGTPYRSRNYGDQARTIREQEELLKGLEEELKQIESEKEEQ